MKNFYTAIIWHEFDEQKYCYMKIFSTKKFVDAKYDIVCVRHSSVLLGIHSDL